MTPEEVQELTQTIVTEIGFAADLVGVIDPQVIPLVVIGKAVSKMIPGLAGDISRWISGNPPTESEIEDLKLKLATLSNTSLP